MDLGGLGLGDALTDNLPSLPVSLMASRTGSPRPRRTSQMKPTVTHGYASAHEPDADERRLPRMRTDPIR